MSGILEAFSPISFLPAEQITQTARKQDERSDRETVAGDEPA